MNPMVMVSLLSLGCPDLFGTAVARMPDLNGDGVHEFVLTDGRLREKGPEGDPCLWILSGRDQRVVSRVAVHEWAGNPRSMRTPEGVGVLGSWGGNLRWNGASGMSSREFDLRERRGSPVIVLPDISHDEFDDLLTFRDLPDAREVVALSGRDLAPLWRRALPRDPGDCNAMLLPPEVGEEDGRVVIVHASRPDGPSGIEMHILSSSTGEIIVSGTAPFEGVCDLSKTRWVPLAYTGNSIFQLVPLGDLDGDGHSDVLLGMEAFGEESRLIAVSSMTADVQFRIDLPHFAKVIASVGDLSGDGLPDLVLSAWDSVQVRSGRDGTLLYSVTPRNGCWFGTGIAGIGDVDGDLAADFVVTASPPGVPDEEGWFVVVSGCDGTILSRHQRKDYVTEDR